MSDIAEEIKTQVETIKQQLSEGALTKEDAEILLLELKSTLTALGDANKEIAIKYIFTALETLGR